MNGTSGPRDGVNSHDAERGKRSRAGWIDADASRNPAPPSDQNSLLEQDPAKGRTRDPELDKPNAGARSNGTGGGSS